MSRGKGSAPISSGGGGGLVDAAVAVPIVIAGLALAGVAKGARKGYQFIKKTRQEASEADMKRWLSEMSENLVKPIEIDDTPFPKISDSESIFNVEIEGIKLDCVFEELQEMNHVNRDSKLWVCDYRIEDSGDRVVVAGLEGTNNDEFRIAFTKNNLGVYQAFGPALSENALSGDVTKVISTFYRNAIYYQLYDWDFGDLRVVDSPDFFRITATDLRNKKYTMEVKINRKNGQVTFSNIPIRLRPHVKQWLERFSECRVTDSGESVKSPGPVRKGAGRISK